MEQDAQLFAALTAAAPVRCAREAFSRFARALFGLGLDVLRGSERPVDALQEHMRDFVAEVFACPVDCDGDEARAVKYGLQATVSVVV